MEGGEVPGSNPLLSWRLGPRGNLKLGWQLQTNGQQGQPLSNFGYLWLLVDPNIPRHDQQQPPAASKDHVGLDVEQLSSVTPITSNNSWGSPPLSMTWRDMVIWYQNSTLDWKWKLWSDSAWSSPRFVEGTYFQLGPHQISFLFSLSLPGANWVTIQ